MSDSAAATALAILTHEPLPLTRFAPEVPDELQRIVRKCLEKDREQRYQSGTFDALELRENGSTIRPPAQQPTVPGSAAAHELPTIGAG